MHQDARKNISHGDCCQPHHWPPLLVGQHPRPLHHWAGHTGQEAGHGVRTQGYALLRFWGRGTPRRRWRGAATYLHIGAASEEVCHVATTSRGYTKSTPIRRTSTSPPPARGSSASPPHVHQFSRTSTFSFYSLSEPHDKLKLPFLPIHASI